MRKTSVTLLGAALASLAAIPGAASASVTGVLVEDHGDRRDGAPTPPRYLVRTSNGRVSLPSPQDPTLVGRAVTVVDDTPARAGLQGRAAPTREPLASVHPQRAIPEAGPRPTLVVLVSLADAAQAFTVDMAREAVFTGPESTSLLFAQQSNHATWLTGVNRADGDVVAVYVGLSSAGCPYREIADAAHQSLAGSWPMASYMHVLYVLPASTSCTWAGRGEMPGTRAWTNGHLSANVVAHELGHNRGLHHAGARRCADAGGQPTPLSDACTGVEYGDPFDVMGLPERLMSIFHRAQAGDLPANGHVMARQAGTYQLGPSNGTEPSGLLVPRKAPGQPVTEFYALERRVTSLPFDDFEPFAPVVNGVTVRLVPRLEDSLQTWLLDMHPGTPEWDDAPLQPGETFNDPQRPIALTVAPDGASVSVSMPPLVDDVPPSAPVLYWVDTGRNRASLQWSEATDDVALDRYEIERDGLVIATTRETRFADRVVGPRTAGYRVVAVDTSGNRAASSPVRAHVPGRRVVSRRVGPVRRVAQRVARRRALRIYVARFKASHATRMRARLNGRLMRSRRGGAITVRIRVPHSARRARILRVTALNDTSSRSKRWKYRAQRRCRPRGNHPRIGRADRLTILNSSRVSAARRCATGAHDRKHP